ncbi:hypothetical protein DITRI_Ditri02bG0169600 [Diplodiscus trichospermus]
MDLQNRILANAIKKLVIHLQDQVVFEVEKYENCSPFKKKKDGLFGFSEGCLSMERWDELNNLFNQTGAMVTFGLNALTRRKKSKTEKELWVGDWQSENTRALMEYTISKIYKLRNELYGTGVSARVEAEQYGKDVIALKKLVKELHPNPKTQPKILGLDGFYEDEWFKIFLQVIGPEVFDGTTYHIYNVFPERLFRHLLVNLAHDNLHLHNLRRNLKSVHSVRTNFDFEGYQNKEEYHLTPKDGNIQSDVVLLNGTPLKLINSSDILDMNSKHVDDSAPISVATHSIVFATIRDFHSRVCA